MISSFDRRTIEAIKREYKRLGPPWFLCFSGGKDSSALLSLVFSSLTEIRSPTKPVKVIFADTGVEVPLVEKFVKKTLRGIKCEAMEYNIPITTQTVKPRLNDRYFVKVIGRGYPPPTNKFRWCTDRLRTGPVQRLITRIGDGKSVVLLGLRQGESMERDRLLSRCQTNNEYFYRQRGTVRTKIYAPIVRYTVRQVWTILKQKEIPISIDANKLISIYKSASGNNSKILNSTDDLVSKGRFGCWTCTVVRKDKAVTAMVQDGHPEFAPLLVFRNWLAQIRDDPNYRCPRHRDGSTGPGPLTLRARKEILKRLLKLQAKTQWELITQAEIDRIQELWKSDSSSPDYLHAEHERIVL